MTAMQNFEAPAPRDDETLLEYRGRLKNAFSAWVGEVLAEDAGDAGAAPDSWRIVAAVAAFDEVEKSSPGSNAVWKERLDTALREDA